MKRGKVKRKRVATTSVPRKTVSRARKASAPRKTTKPKTNAAPERKRPSRPAKTAGPPKPAGNTTPVAGSGRGADAGVTSAAPSAPVAALPSFRQVRLLQRNREHWVRFGHGRFEHVRTFAGPGWQAIVFACQIPDEWFNVPARFDIVDERRIGHTGTGRFVRALFPAGSVRIEGIGLLREWMSATETLEEQ